MSNKIITDDILQKSIQDTIQIIADNIFEFESYSDESIAELFSLTPEEAQHISDLIADTVISQYKLWSSKKVSDELISAKNECNDYTDTRLANISSISLKYCTTLPTTGESNCIYILKSTDSSPDTLNLYDGTWITIGSFTIKLDDFYKKSEVDTKLDLKADKTEILAQDDVITDTSLATTTNVLSATTTIEELDKKVDKTSIVTSISSTSTDDTVPSAKAVYDKTIESQFGIAVTSTSQFGNDYLRFPCGIYRITTDALHRSMINIPPTNLSGVLYVTTQLADLNKNLLTDTWVYRDYKYIDYTGKIYVRSLYSRDVAGTIHYDSGWQKVCTTNVADVPLTMITFSNIANYNLNSGGIHSHYRIKNGICYIDLDVVCVTPKSSGNWSYINTGHPIPFREDGKAVYFVMGGEDGKSNVNGIIDTQGRIGLLFGTAGIRYVTSLSYPVES